VSNLVRKTVYLQINPRPISRVRMLCGQQVGQFGFLTGIPVNSHTKSTRTRTLVPTGMICITFYNLFHNRCKFV